MSKFFRYAWLVFIPVWLYGQSELYIRKSTVPLPLRENAGVGNMITGVDLDGDGKKEMYMVNNNWDDAGQQLIPSIYKYEFNGTSWDSVWGTRIAVPLQNTWPGLTYGDWDNDGRKEVIWCPVNNITAANPRPDRIVVFESKGDGSDIMGIADTGNTFRPNAKFVVDTAASYNFRPFKIELTDFDRDGVKELIIADRASSTTGYRFAFVSVNNIPNNGDASETWTVEYSGKTLTNLLGGNVYDFAVMDSTCYFLTSAGNIIPVKYVTGSGYQLGTQQTGAAPGGSWKSAVTVDLDNNNSKEIVFASWSGTTSTKIYVLRKQGDTLAATPIADFANLIGPAGTSRMYGGAVGDINADGKADFVFGTRDAVPNAAVVRLSYKGGSITDTNSYAKSIMDQGFVATNATGRWDVLTLSNLDSEAGDELAYTNGFGVSSGPEARTPVIIVKRVALNFISIKEARRDNNNDGVPDRVGDTVTVLGIVNSVNFTRLSNRFQYVIQDTTGGITITKGSQTGGGPVYKLGDRLLVKGVVGYFRGTTQMDIPDLATNVTFLDSANTLVPYQLTLNDFIANGERYEGTYIQFAGVSKTSGSVAWPTTSADANMTVWDGYKSLTLRVSRNTNVPGSPEPVWPAKITGVATQFTPDTALANAKSGYQISPNYIADIVGAQAVPPSKYFFLSSPANNATVTVTDSNNTFSAKWGKAVDLNNDPIVYQFVLLTSPAFTSTALTDTVYNFDGRRVLQWLGTNDSIKVRWTVKAKGNEVTLVSSVDTFTVTFKKRLTVAVKEDNMVPEKFFVDQNYPNPFNPATTIRFGIPQDEQVDLRVYNILGQEVMVLINNELMKAGSYKSNFNAANLPSGTYMYRLQTSANVVTKKMLLVK